jgi:hypothetical protein
MQTDINKLLSRIKNNICTSPPLRLYVDRKTDISYTYYSGNGKYLGALTVRTRDC